MGAGRRAARRVGLRAAHGKVVAQPLPAPDAQAEHPRARKKEPLPLLRRVHTRALVRGNETIGHRVCVE